jgi:predicted PurR-regulated permease PerM
MARNENHMIEKMELILPNLLIFLLAIAFTYYVAPHVTPIVAAILAIAFLVYGIYDHYQLFASEYRLSTWQEVAEVYAPAIMLGSVILFVIYGIFTFFESGKVPIPEMPNIPSFNTTQLNSINNSLGNFGSSVSNSFNSIGDSFNSLGNSFSNGVNSLVSSSNQNRGNNKNKNHSRSFLETI